jgi:hypothetical protein
MHPLKSPGPDGMSPIFFQKFWHIIKKDVITFVLNFLNKGEMNTRVNFTHIVLLSNVQQPELVTQFRPISLCNVAYRLASKVMANRVRPMMDQIISQSQSAFIPGRLISDNVLIAHEIHHAMKVKTGGRNGEMSIKLDMSKAFDRIEWVFVLKTLQKLGFPVIFVDRIRMCLSSVQFSFLLNGEEFGQLTPQRGIRQGDPLSPYLFIICSEVLSMLLTDLASAGRIHGAAASKYGPRISHLFFADDTLLFGKATEEEAARIHWH